ncbi:2097_t:CDS:2, partial [Funneliformis geosporum]
MSFNKNAQEDDNELNESGYTSLNYKVAIASYLEMCQGQGSYNKFLINNKSLIISELSGRPWKNQNLVWKNKFITAAEKVIGGKHLVKQESVAFHKYNALYGLNGFRLAFQLVSCMLRVYMMTQGAPAGLREEDTNECFWLEIENYQKLQLLKANQVKLKRKIDLLSLEILDRSISQQASEILDLYGPSQKKLRCDNEIDENDDVIHHENISLQNKKKLDLKRFREEISEEIHKEICQVREEMYESCKEIFEDSKVTSKEICDAIKELNGWRSTSDKKRTQKLLYSNDNISTKLLNPGSARKGVAVNILPVSNVKLCQEETVEVDVSESKVAEISKYRKFTYYYCI